MVPAPCSSSASGLRCRPTDSAPPAAAPAPASALGTAAPARLVLRGKKRGAPRHKNPETAGSAPASRLRDNSLRSLFRSLARLVFGRCFPRGQIKACSVKDATAGPIDAELTAHPMRILVLNRKRIGSSQTGKGLKMPNRKPAKTAKTSRKAEEVQKSRPRARSSSAPI
jgi:hypothetical protein